MSFEVFLNCFKSGKPAGVDRSVVRNLFAVNEGESEHNYWKLCYSEKEWCNVSVCPLESTPDLLTALTVIRPCQDVRLWQSVLGVMRAGNFVLYWPGNHAPLVAASSVTVHLPVDMISALGEPEVVDGAADVLRAIEKS